jgi:hypothetical protein
MAWCVALAMLGSVTLEAKLPTVKIVVRGAGLARPIELTDEKLLANFRVWAGPGTSSNEAQSLIVDWGQGTAAVPAKGLTRYEVSFYAALPEPRLVYVVTYCYDRAAGRGYVYVPGSSLNLGTILHGNEEQWFHAWRLWDEWIAERLH